MSAHDCRHYWRPIGRQSRCAQITGTAAGHRCHAAPLLRRAKSPMRGWRRPQGHLSLPSARAGTTENRHGRTRRREESRCERRRGIPPNNCRPRAPPKHPILARCRAGWIDCPIFQRAVVVPSYQSAAHSHTLPLRSHVPPRTHLWFAPHICRLATCILAPHDIITNKLVSPGYSQLSGPLAAYSHSASVGSRAPRSHKMRRLAPGDLLAGTCAPVHRLSEAACH